jgi:glycosyltransferase involved in cell wall biosynthesis
LKLSLIVPVYNAAAFLPEFWASLRPQLLSCKDVEVTFINDGSADDSKKLLEEISKASSQVKILDQENLGVSVARNRGVENSQGEYLAFLDPDDIPSECYLDAVLGAISENPVDIVVFAYQITIGGVVSDKRLWIKKCDGLNGPEYFDRKLKHHRQIERRPWNKVYKAELISSNGIKFNSSLRLGQDMVFNVQAFLYAKNVKAVDKVVYIYNKNNPHSSTALARTNITLGIDRRLILSRLMRSALEDWKATGQIRFNMLGFSYRETIRATAKLIRLLKDGSERKKYSKQLLSELNQYSVKDIRQYLTLTDLKFYLLLKIYSI